MIRGVWRATAHSFTKSQTLLSVHVHVCAHTHTHAVLGINKEGVKIMQDYLILLVQRELFGFVRSLVRMPFSFEKHKWYVFMFERWSVDSVYKKQLKMPSKP